MPPDFDDLRLFVAVADASGFRDAARLTGRSASALSEAVRRLEASLGVRLLHRTTRTVVPTEQGRGLLDRLRPALAEIAGALGAVGDSRDQAAGTLRLNVPTSAARLVLPPIVAPFLERYPLIRLEIVVEDGFVDVLADGCDAGIRYDERLEADMIAVPIGPRVQRYATAAAPSYLARHGCPAHPRDLVGHRCLRGQFRSGVMPPWEFERDGEVVRVEPTGPLLVRLGGGADLAVDAAVRGLGVVQLFEEWLRPELDRGVLEPVLADWWQPFPGPFLYYGGRRHLPAPLRLFVDFVKRRPSASPVSLPGRD